MGSSRWPRRSGGHDSVKPSGPMMMLPSSIMILLGMTVSLCSRCTARTFTHAAPCRGRPVPIAPGPSPFALPFRPATAYDHSKQTVTGGNIMKNAALLGLFVLAASAQGATAQQGNLSDQQKMGRQVFAQSCGVCHLPPSLGSRTYGPALNKDAGGGDDDVMREFITNGTPRMPAFKYYLKADQIEAIISYVRTVAVQAAAAPARRAGGGGEP